MSALALPATATTSITIPIPTSTPAHINLVRDTTASPSPTAAPTGVFITTEHITIPGVTDDHVTIPAKTIDIAKPTCIHTITPDKNGYVPPGTCGALYDYYPSFAAALVFSVLFGILSVAHITQAAILKTVGFPRSFEDVEENANWRQKFCWVLIMGALWETFSFVFRSISTKHQQSAGIELVSSIFVLLAPLCGCPAFPPAKLSSLTTPRDQRIRLHGSRANDPFLSPQS
jgi:hypothetical protein